MDRFLDFLKILGQLFFLFYVSALEILKKLWNLGFFAMGHFLIHGLVLEILKKIFFHKFEHFFDIKHFLNFVLVPLDRFENQYQIVQILIYPQSIFKSPTKLVTCKLLVCFFLNSKLGKPQTNSTFVAHSWMFR